MKEIQKIIDTYDVLDFQKTQLALATVVRVEQSSYRRIGARMLVKNNGDWIGGISGGCLEGDALKRAKVAILKNTSSIVTYDTTKDDAHQIGIGLGCRGRIDVLFSPIDPNDKNNPIEILKPLVNKRAASVLLQIINVSDQWADLRGTLFQEIQSKEIAGILQVKETKIEHWISEAKRQKKSLVFKHTNEADVSFEMLIEFIRPKIKLLIIGDNYDVHALIAISQSLAWETHIAGKRIMLNQFAFKHSHKVYPLNKATHIKIDAYTAVVLMSHDYKTDLQLLPHFIQQNPNYIGLLGPRKRMQKLQKDLLEKYPDINLEQLPNLFAPVGLDIGAESPEEIAAAIAAEIISVFRNRTGQPLRERIGPIH